MNQLFNATSRKVSLFTSSFLQERSWTRTPIQPPSWIFNCYTVSHSVIIVRGDIFLLSNDFCTEFLRKIYVKKRFQWYCLSFVVLINPELFLFSLFPDQRHKTVTSFSVFRQNWTALWGGVILLIHVDKSKGIHNLNVCCDYFVGISWLTGW